ncbi:MAG: 2-dehydro-3-deoxyphosphooctonate aldolase [Bacteroidota bacterium]
MKTIYTFLLALGLFGIVACSGSRKASQTHSPPKLLNEYTFELREISTDPEYGYTEKKPIKVGGASSSEGPKNERRFLNALAGPNGEKITYKRLRSCCAFKSDNSPMGAGMLDVYELEWDGLDKPVQLYINMYDPGEIKAPKDFTIK